MLLSRTVSGESTSFPIPMRGNELDMGYQLEVHATASFPIPMRGNEKHQGGRLRHARGVPNPHEG